MKRTLLAAAVAGIAAIAVPAAAQAPAPTTTQPSPGHEMGSQPGGEHGGAAMMPGGEGGGEMGGREMGGGEMMRHMMMHRMMMRRMRMHADPKERCIDRLARRAARYAYIEVELGLTAQQRPLWDKIETIGKAAQQKERALCDQLKPGGTATVLDRMDRAQAFLSARLDALKSAKPAVEALYQALTPEQKAIFDRPFHRD